MAVVVLSMMLARCGKPRPPAAILQPLPGATLFREEIACDPAINAAMFDLMQVLRKEFGTLSIERYRVPPDAHFARIADHDRRQLPANWQAGSYPTDHPAYRLIAWNNGGWAQRRFLALALLNEVGCSEHLPYSILLVAVPAEE